MSIGTATTADYTEGYSAGVEWAEQDLRNSMPTSDSLANLAEEARICTMRWARAFYLGALRGYRARTRTRTGGRWGT